MDELKLLFSPDSNSQDKCKLLSEQHSNALSLEAETVSMYSPGVVENNEFIARQIFSPIHYDESSDEIKPSAFDDVSNKGLSVNRLVFIDEVETHEHGKLKADRDNERLSSSGKPARTYLGFSKANVQDIRNYIEEDARVFAVYDSALIDAKFHADVCLIMQESSSSGLSKKAANLYRRKKLQLIFSGLQGCV